jgi:Cdc6-like AAA superfamily ATPase
MHYLRDNYKLHNVVLTLRDTLSSYTSKNIVDHLFDVLKDYQISSSQITFFIADNVTNNDKALKLLSDRITLNLVTSRIRYTSYIFNLVYSAILFGVNAEALEDAQYNFSQPQDKDDHNNDSESLLGSQALQ